MTPDLEEGVSETNTVDLRFEPSYAHLHVQTQVSSTSIYGTG